MDCLETAKTVLERIKSSGADMGECTVGGGANTEIYYESGKISMIRSVFSSSLFVKVIKDGKKGTANMNTCDGASIAAAVNAALLASEHASPDGAEGVSDEAENKSFTRGAKEPDRDALYRLMRGFVDDVKRDYPKISFDSVSVMHMYGEKVYMNTAGVILQSSDGASAHSTMFMAREGEITSSFNYFGSVFSDLETPLIDRGMNRMILAETEKQIETKTLEGKFEGEVIIAPPCLDDFISSIQSNFLSDSVHIENTSIWKDSLGKTVAAPEFTLRANPASEELPGGYFITGDGYVARNMDIIENGVLKNFTLSRYGAAKTGKKRSPNTGGGYVVEAGDKSLEELIAPVKKGLLLNRFSGGSPGVNGDFTGVAKNSFLIEDGRVTKALSEVMVSGNLAGMLKNITGISKERVNDGAAILPWVRVSGIVISGK